jgi:ornithine carbamoyltransferase
MLWKLETEMGKKMDGDKSEHVIEAMGVLSRYFDGLGIRAFARGVRREEDLLDQTFTSFMENAKIPVFNMESAVYHPCQAMADLLTIRELLGGFKGRKISIVWATHPLAVPMAVPNSILLAATLVGMDVTLAHPGGFELQDGILGMAKDFAGRSGGSPASSTTARRARDAGSSRQGLGRALTVRGQGGRGGPPEEALGLDRRYASHGPHPEGVLHALPSRPPERRRDR